MRPLPLVFGVDHARSYGYSDGQIRRRVAHREWISLRRGVYCTRETRHRLDSDARLAELVQCTASMLTIPAPAWASHASARRLHELPALHNDPGTAQLTVQPDKKFDRSRRLDDTDVLPALVPTAHRTTYRGLPLLSVARTVVDTARNRDLADGLIAADAALGRELTTADKLSETLGDCVGWPGIVGARRVVTHASGKRESPLESRSFAFFLEYELPLPDCQVDLFASDGRFLGRVDFYWHAYRLIGEADGKVKYVEDFPDGPPTQERLWRERLRHDDFDDDDRSIVRWTHGDLTVRPDATGERLRRAFRRAGRRLRS